MSKAATQAVYGRRLRDQVYDLIKEDLKRGSFPSNQRFFEVELAEKYGVSRTPVREALFQLVRDGLLISEERGYTLPTDTPKRFADRMEVHLLLDPKVAYYAAGKESPRLAKNLQKVFLRAQRAHSDNKYTAYIDASHEFRVGIREMCDNEPLRRCAMLIEDQFLPARNELFKAPQHREMDLKYNARILQAIEAGDQAGAETATRDYMTAVSQLDLGNSTEGTPADESNIHAPKRRPRKASTRE